MGSVRSVARRPLPPHGRLRHHQADLRDPAARAFLSRVDVLFHLGFSLWRDRGRRKTSSLNRDGTTNVLAAGPGHVVLASSAATYGAWPTNPLPMAESHPARPNPQCRYACDKLAVERECAETAPTAALRLAAVLGPGADPRVARAAAGYRLAVPAVRGVRQAVQFLHEADAAEALVAAGLTRVTGVINVAPADWLDEEAVARVSGGRVVRLPPRVLLAGSESARRLGLLPFGADRAVLLQGPLALDPSQAAERLGWRATRGSHEVLAAFLNRPSA